MNELSFRIYELASCGYCCTQIMVKLILEQEDTENEDLIKAMNGLCGGIGFSDRACGVLTGGICALSLYGGKGKDNEYRKEELGQMIKEYKEWFEEEFESTQCNDLAGYEVLIDEGGQQSYPVKCGNIIGKGFDKVWRILQEHNYELGERE